MQDLDTQKREVEQELDMYKKMGESAYNTAKGQVTTIEEMQDKIDTLEQQQEGLHRQEEVLNKELEDRERLLDESIQQHTLEKTQLEETISNQTKSIDTLKEMVQELINSDMKVNISPEQLEELEKSKQTITDLQAELQFTNDQLGKRDIIYEENVKAQEVIKTLQDTIISLETNPKMTETQANELNALKNRVKVLEDDLMITKEELGDEEENRLTEKTQAAEHIEKQQDVIKKLQETITSLESNSNMTEQQVKDINDLREKITSLNEELNYVNSELKDRDEKLDAYESRGQNEKGETGKEGKTMPDNAVQSTNEPNIEPTTETTRGLQEFVVRIKYPVPGSAEHVINVIGDSGTSTEANIMNISNELNTSSNSTTNAPAYPPIREEPPPYTATGGSKNKRRNIGLFTSDEFIKF